MLRPIQYWLRLVNPHIFGIDDLIIGMIGSAVVGAGASAYSARKANETNQQMMQFNSNESEAARNFNSAQADINRGFQERMTYHEEQWNAQMASQMYQRRVDDLKNAGLNPMLAISGGGASVAPVAAPSGSAASGPAASVSGLHNPGQAAAMALQSAGVLANIQNMGADTRLKEAQTNREMASAGQMQAQTQDILWKLDNVVPEQMHLLRAQTGSEIWKQTVDAARTEVLRIEKGLKTAEIDNVQASAAFTNVKTLMENLALPQARNAANAQDSWWMRNISPYLPDLLKSSNTIRSLK